MMEVGRLAWHEAERVVDVLCEAFDEYPVMRHVLGAPRADDVERLRVLIGFFVRARELRGEPVFGVVEGGSLLAAATTSFPDATAVPEAFEAARARTWTSLGEDARARYEACGVAWRALSVERPHVHLNMIGVRPEQRGRGLARRLLERVQRLSVETPGSEGVSLTTENPRNVALYEHVGYRVTGQATIAPGLETWALFRENG